MLFQGLTFAQVDAVVASINPQGFFAQAGPLQVFVSAHVCVAGCLVYDADSGSAADTRLRS